MQARTSLWSIELTAGRATFRRMLFLAMPAFALIGAAGYLMPAHRTGADSHFHSNFADGGLASLVAFAFVAFVVIALRKLRLGAGLIAGVLSMGGAVLALLPVVLAHFLSRVEHEVGQPVFVIGVLGMFCAGALALLAEPVLYVLERRRIERATMPAQLPVARVYA